MRKRFFISVTIFILLPLLFFICCKILQNSPWGKSMDENSLGTVSFGVEVNVNEESETWIVREFPGGEYVQCMFDIEIIEGTGRILIEKIASKTIENINMDMVMKKKVIEFELREEGVHSYDLTSYLGEGIYKFSVITEDGSIIGNFQMNIYSSHWQSLIEKFR